MSAAIAYRSRWAVSEPELRIMQAEWSYNYEAAIRHADATLANLYKIRDRLVRVEERVSELAEQIRRQKTAD